MPVAKRNRSCILQNVQSAAVHDQRGAVDKAGLRGGQEADRGGDILGLADCALHLFRTLFNIRVVPEHWRVDRAWRNAIDAQFARRDLLAEAARERLHPALRRRVRYNIPGGLVRVYATDIHKRTARLHVRRCVLAEEKYGTEIYV